MKKNILISVILLVTLGLTACSGSKNTGSSGDYISEAEKQIPLVKHPLFGSVPSLQEQFVKALDLLDDAFETERDAIRATANNDNYEKVTAKIKEFDKEQETVENEINKYFTGKIDEAMKEIIGKEIPIEPDPKTYSTAKAIIVGYKYHGGGNGNIIVNASFTPARNLKTFGRKYTNISWKWLNDSGEEKGSGVIMFDNPFKAGDEVKLDSISVSDNDIAKIAFTDN